MGDFQANVRAVRDQIAASNAAPSTRREMQGIVDGIVEMREQLEAKDARIEALEAERDELLARERKRVERLGQHPDSVREACAAAEAREARLREALTDARDLFAEGLDEHALEQIEAALAGQEASDA